MEYTMEQRAELIMEACLQENSVNPLEIFDRIAANDFVRMHGPEHHVLDGACILTAFHNAGGKLHLRTALEKICTEGMRMPGAMCGLWGVCGSVASIGAALAIIDDTGPLTTDGSWGLHMEYTSEALKNMAAVGGPRCCKRNAYIAMQAAIAFINVHYDVKLVSKAVHCTYSAKNQQCLQLRCPFHA